MPKQPKYDQFLILFNYCLAIIYPWVGAVLIPQPNNSEFEQALWLFEDRKIKGRRNSSKTKQ